MEMITQDVAQKIQKDLERENHGFWDQFAWEIQDGGQFLLVQVYISSAQNSKENLAQIKNILRNKLDPIMPVSKSEYTWMGVIKFDNQVVDSVFGGDVP